MENQWTVIASDTNVSRLYMLLNLMEQKDIPAQILNKVDSVYPSIGEAELYVDAAFRLKALQIIHEAQNESPDTFQD
ncbi:MAG TPA: DUF2007 domain-containing protein [Flavobacteriales bacterium]|nr:DUF2007 domain-containing protein [Flavobacteriales bacterium]